MITTTVDPEIHEVVELLADKPPKNASASTIDFQDLGFAEYRDHFAILINDCFTESECRALLNSAQCSAFQKWDQAMINVGNGQQMLSTDVRLCDRILWDDSGVAGKVLDRIIQFLPSDIVTLSDKPLLTGKKSVMLNETWRISRLNERLRFLKYTKGMYFRPHCDGSYVTANGKETSFLTLHLYLNGDEAPPAAQWAAERDQDKPLLGGATRFFSWQGDQQWDVNPRAGSVLVFQHRNLLHSGENVRQGTKYTMRSDILYTRVEE